jgi:putative SOS response-associated peptidase YedK
VLLLDTHVFLLGNMRRAFPSPCGEYFRSMCGRYTLTHQEDIATEFEAAVGPSATQDPWWKPRFNVAPTQPAPVVTMHDGTRTIEMMRWGLIPFWAGHDGKRAPLMINARLESLNGKQFFREALERKRCLVPSDGFFEWVAAARHTRGGSTKAPPRPFYFHPRSHGIFAFAGLWARSRTGSGHEQHSFTIITTGANELVRSIHDRMPIVLPPSGYAAWLDPALDGDGARALLDVPAGSSDWIREPVSTRVNKVDHDDPGCIAPEPQGNSPAQGRLFD